MLKRLFDVVVSTIALVLLSPLFLLLAIAIKAEDGGSVFYRGTRVGRGGKPFKIFKFRSMNMGADKGASSTSAGDPRVTRCGAFIRKYKLDEFSQLINVWLGDMSLVGPRPEVSRFVEMYTFEERQLLSLRPGITDWASIKFHNEAEILQSSGIDDPDEAYMKLIRPEKIRLQLEYLKHHSFATDLRIVMETFLVLLRTRLKTAPDTAMYETSSAATTKERKRRDGL